MSTKSNTIGLTKAQAKRLYKQLMSSLHFDETVSYLDVELTVNGHTVDALLIWAISKPGGEHYRGARVMVLFRAPDGTLMYGYMHASGTYHLNAIAKAILAMNGSPYATADAPDLTSFGTTRIWEPRIIPEL